MKQAEVFRIKAYGKSELAMIYFPRLTKKGAMKKLESWLRKNPRLCYLIRKGIYDYTPKQVRQIVEEVGEPFDIQ